MGSATRVYFVPLVISYFFESSCSLKPCIPVFTFEEAVTSSRFYWLASGRKVFTSQPCQRYWGSLRFFVWMHLLHSSCFLWRRSLRLCVFSWSHKARPGVESLLFIFSRAVPWSVCSVLCTFSQSSRFSWMAISVCSLWELACIVCRGAWSVGYRRGLHGALGVHSG